MTAVTGSPLDAVVAVDPRENGGTFTIRVTVTEGSGAGAQSWTGTTTVTVPEDPDGISGTISYAGTKSGTVYVSCLDGITAGAGTTALPEFNTTGHMPPVPYRLHGVGCTGTVFAWMDWLGVHNFSFGVDPSGNQTIPSGSPRSLNLAIGDQPQPPGTDTMVDAAIDSIFPEVDGAVIQYTTYYDTTEDPVWNFFSQAGNEWASSYTVWYTTASTPPTDMSGATNHVTVVPGTKKLALLTGLTGGTAYSFAIQEVPAWGTSLSPSTVVWTAPIEIPASGSGSDMQIKGSVDLTAGFNSTYPTGVTPYLHVLAFDHSSDPARICAAGGAAIDTTSPLTAFDVRDLPDGYLPDGGMRDAGGVPGGGRTYDVGFFIAQDGGSYLLPTDYLGQTISTQAIIPSFYMQSYVSDQPNPAETGLTETAHAGINQLDSIYTLPPEQAVAYTGTLVLDNAAASGQTIYGYHVVISGTRPFNFVRRLAWAWDPTPAQDLFDANPISTNDTPVPFFAATWSTPQTGAPPASGSQVNFLVEYGDDNSQEFVTSTIQDTLTNGLSVTITPMSSGDVSSATPTFTWTAASGSTPDNVIDYYYLYITNTSGTVASTKLTLPSTLQWTTPSLANGTYTYFLLAVDRWGDTEVNQGTFVVSH